MKQDRFFLSMAEVEQAVKQKMAELKPLLVGQKVFMNIVSLWNFRGQFVEVTQNTNGNYTVYLMSKQEAEKWEQGDGSECEDMGGRKIGMAPDVLISESLRMRRRKRKPGREKGR